MGMLCGMDGDSLEEWDLGMVKIAVRSYNPSLMNYVVDPRFKTPRRTVLNLC